MNLKITNYQLGIDQVVSRGRVVMVWYLACECVIGACGHCYSMQCDSTTKNYIEVTSM